jgi:8-oxo-dGTP diphosphatase
MAGPKHQNTPASYLVLIKENKVLLSRRFNTGYEDGKYSMIAGHLEKGETFTKAIIREAKEEAGLIIKPEDLEIVHIMHRDNGRAENNEYIDTFILAKKWKGTIEIKEKNKCDDLSWFDLDNLPENILPHVRLALYNMKNKIFYSEYGWK